MCKSVWIYPRKSSVYGFRCDSVCKIRSPFDSELVRVYIVWAEIRRPVDRPGRSSHERIDRGAIDRGTWEQASFWPVDGHRPGLPLLPTGLDRPTNPRAKMPKPLLRRSIVLQSHRPGYQLVHRLGLQNSIFSPSLQLLLPGCYRRLPQPWLNTTYLLTHDQILTKW